MGKSVYSLFPNESNLTIVFPTLSRGHRWYVWHSRLDAVTATDGRPAARQGLPGRIPTLRHLHRLPRVPSLSLRTDGHQQL